MTVEEAIELVIQAGAIGRPGEVILLDMGEPIRIAEVAERMAARGKRPVRIVYTGLRPGEKLHEALLGQEEVDERPIHPAISHVPVPAIDPLEVRMSDRTLPAETVIDDLRQQCDSRPVHPAWQG